MLTVHNVNKQYPGNRQALRGASFELREGERVILLGPNGAGKTTLIKCIVGLVAPDGGSIHLNGVDVVCRSSYARQSVAVVFEEADNSYSYCR
ncbi:ATP-binding cassette domain-containing protein [Geobacillus proteiniphilus]|uniref:ATP-binding cassette domain-containing protein n=1 Tax=Geobacillus proteiniphilus TaxID=860353 RepID=A0ABY9MI24_9BACL|nr:ATP-binding cassette domain-containing protein [Geobacillus proteiniphilus]WMJ17701.1 ATP-binding cassette domain-containing protein [Geobacillus proteiniphilus]